VLLALDFDVGAWDPVVRVVPFVAGVVLFIANTLSLVRTMVIPRAIPSLLAAMVTRLVNRAYGFFARWHRSFPRRDRILSWNGPIAVFANLAAWLLIYVLAYGLMIFGISEYSFSVSLQSAASALFTLGLFGSPTVDQSYVEFMAAATGPVVIALLIGFLPTLYSAWLTRENATSLLGTMAGEPAWGPELLARASLLNTQDRLAEIFDSWTRWAADVRLAQTLYPPLSRMRSAIAERHWLISLLAVVDAAALSNALNSKGPRARALALIEEGSLTMNALLAVELSQRTARTLRLTARHAMRLRHRSSDHDPFLAHLDEIPADTPGISAVRKAITTDTLRTGIGTAGGEILGRESHQIQITRAEFDTAVAMLREAGTTIDTDPDEAWQYFSATRQRYEYAAYQLASIYAAVRAPWSGDRIPTTDVIRPTSAVSQDEVSHDPEDPSETTA
jgi:hypothetical protein